MNWKEFTLVDADGTMMTYESGDECYTDAMKEFRATGGIHGWFFDTAEEIDPEQAWNAGPSVDDIDWAGIDD